MKTRSVSPRPALLPENALAAYNPSKAQRQKINVSPSDTEPPVRLSGMIKLLSAVPPPDEKTIRELNDLAAKRPFCAFRKVRRYDTL